MVNKNVGVGFGVVYVLVGVVGFFLTGFSDFASVTGPTLFGFMLNPLHNIVHILVGALLIAGGLASIAISKRVNRGSGVLPGSMHVGLRHAGLIRCCEQCPTLANPEFQHGKE